MGGDHGPMPRRRHPADQRPHPQVQQTRTDPNDVHQGIESPHLMEVHLLRRMAVDRPLRLRQQGEDREHPLAQRGRQGGGEQPLPQGPPGPVVRLMLQGLHLQPAPAQATAVPLRDPDPVATLQAQGRQGAMHHGLRHP